MGHNLCRYAKVVFADEVQTPWWGSARWNQVDP
jgi:hypothetical protein